MLATRALVDADAGRVWRLLVDTARWPEWGPSVRAVECASRIIGPGVTGRVQTAPGPWLDFEITDWVDGCYWRWRVAGVPATGHRVVDHGPGRSQVVFEVPAWAPFYLPVCAVAVRRIARIVATS